MFGVAIGIITMRFAAGIFTWMILREPILKPAAYLVVFNIGAELLLDEFLGIEVGAGLKFTISAGTLILFVIYAHLKPLHVFQPVFNWLAEGMANINELFDWVLVPVVLVVKILFKGIFFVLRPIINLFNPQSVIVSQEDQVTFDKERHKKRKRAGKQ
jgi:tellurite resistance protein TerC